MTARILVILTLASICMMDATAQVSALWTVHSSGSFYDLTHDSAHQHIVLTTLADSAVRYQRYDLQGDGVSSSVFPTSLNSLRGLKASEAGYFAWKNEPLGCQLKYCQNSVSVGKLDSNGEALWSWRHPGALGEHVSIPATYVDDGGSIVFGLKSSMMQGEGTTLYKLDASGEEIWQTQMAAYETPSVIYGRAEGGYLVFGTVAGYGNYPSGSDVICPFVMHVSDDGSALDRDCLLDDAGGYHVAGTSRAPDGDFLFVLAHRQAEVTPIRLLRVSPDGVPVLSSAGIARGGTRYNLEPMAVASTTDRGYWLAGRSGEHEAYETRIMRLGADGKLLWEGVIDLTGTGAEHVQRVLSLPDGSLLLGGEAEGAFVTRVNVAEGTSSERHNHNEPLRFNVYPMPAYETVHFEVEIDHPAQVTATIYDVTGRTVRTIPGVGSLGAGVHAIKWNGNDDAGRRLPSGIYLARIATSAVSLTRTVVLAR